MPKNVGLVDQWLRVLIGCALVAAIFLAETSWRWLGLAGFMPLASGFLRWCPFYSYWGVTTCPGESDFV